MVKKFLFRLSFAIIVLALIFVMAGCGKSEENNTESKNNVSSNEANERNIATNTIDTTGSTDSTDSSIVKEGVYEMVLRAEDEELSAGDICLELKDGKITIVNGFAVVVEQGTYEMKGNKLVGQYDTMIYLDHANGGETTKEVSEAFDFDILEDGSLRDNNGFGTPIDNLQFVGRIYRLTDE